VWALCVGGRSVGKLAIVADKADFINDFSALLTV
jgi:hypothetical protein